MTTIAAAAPALASTDRSRTSGTDLSIEIATGLAAAEAVWREFERDAVMSPYGRFDWVSAYAGSVEGREAIRVAVARDAAGRVAAILPCSVARRFGTTIGAAPGGKHANFNLPLMRPDIANSLTPEGATKLLHEVGRAIGLDVVALPNVPVSWNERPNPFASHGRPSPSHASSLRLEGDGDATLARSMSPDARKKLRNKVRGLAKQGAVAVLEARSEAEVDRILDAFFHQKETRFRELGIPDPFTDPAMRSFLRAGALARLDEGRPAIELYGLTVDGRIVAVLGGAADALRLSGMFVSFEPGETARFSPGEILATEIIRRQCERGRQVFDLGVGEARYKRNLCDSIEPLVDVVVPITLRGRLHGAARGSLVTLKRRIKASPRAMAALSRVRRGLSRIRA